MSSSLLPFLTSWLMSPLKSDVQTAAIQQTIEDRDRGGFTTPDRQQAHLSFHDTGLRGSRGALIVLDALATNPFAHKLTLSHNQLGDLGVRDLSNRVRFLKNRRTVLVHELNLASNSLTNLALGDLCQSWEGLKELYLSNNQIDLQSSPSPMLHLGNLTLLSLTSNPINCQSISNLFRDPNFAPMELTTLHLSACGLDLSVAVSLATWLEDRNRSGKLEWLAVNGNRWGTAGCERITWALARKGGNCHLLRLEMLACGDSSWLNGSAVNRATTEDIEQPLADDQNLLDQIQLMAFRDAEDLEHCRSAFQLHKTWNQLLKKCESRNQALRIATRRAALGLVSSARLILLSSPVGSLSNFDQKIPNRDIFPWNRLPEEIKFNVWRWVSILSAFPKLKPSNEHEPESDHSSSGNDPVKAPRHHEAEEGMHDEIPYPLNAVQLNKLIEYAQDRKTLQAEIFQREEFIFNHGFPLKKSHDMDHKFPKKSSLHRLLIQDQRVELEIDRLGRSLLLKTCDCQRFLGSL